MKVLIIEDEIRIAKRIERMVAAFFGAQLSILHKCEALADGLLYLENNPIDLLFLDLNLNGEDGFEVLESITARSFHTVIISAHTHLAIKAFAYGVLDFVPKPFDEQRLNQALLRYSAQKNSSTNNMNFLAVKKAGTLSLIAVKDLYYIKGAGIYAELHLQNGKCELHDKSLDKLQQLLSDDFERIHKSYIVTISAIEKILVSSGSKYNALLKNGTVLPIGRSRYKALKARLG